MEELKQVIIEAILEGNKRSYEMGYCGIGKSLNGKDPNELLTIKQICKEFNMGENKVRKIFNDPELPVQRYTMPFKVTRQAFNKYINVSHDNLSERK